MWCSICELSQDSKEEWSYESAFAKGMWNMWWGGVGIYCDSCGPGS
jgi:hypothetical protein